MAINTKLYIETYIKIRDKSAKIVPLKLNAGQQRLYDVIKAQKQAHKPVRVIILKARQIGFSTLTEAIIFKESVTKNNINSGIIAHKDDSTTNLFNMSKLMYNSLPDAIKPMRKASNAKEIIFDNSDGTGLNSKIKCMTAGGSGVGRSDTFNNLHISELAFWACNKQDTLAGLLQTVPNNNSSMIIIESTANGYDYFKELWDAAVDGKNDFVPLFVGWHEMADYQMPYNGFVLTDEEIRIKELFHLSDNQLTWRRWCIANNCGGDTEKFKQEYPITPEEAFRTTGKGVFDNNKIIERLQEIKPPIKQGYFDYKDNSAAITDIKWIDDKNGSVRIYEEPDRIIPYVAGVDTSGQGTDAHGIHIINNYTGKQVATMQYNGKSREMNRQVYCLFKIYYEPFAGIEANYGTGIALIEMLEEYGYRNLYFRTPLDSDRKRSNRKYGFWTSDHTKDIIITQLGNIIDDNIGLINDEATLKEMLVFVRDGSKMGAIDGKHDDLVMSLAIAFYMRQFYRSHIDGELIPKHYDFDFQRPKQDTITGGNIIVY